MNALGPPVHRDYSSRGHGSTSVYYDNAPRSPSQTPPRFRHEYEEPDSYFSLRPISRSPTAPPPESSNAALARAKARAEALQRAISSASSKRADSSSPPSKSSPSDRFPARPSLSIFNAPTATYMWPNFQASSQMKYGPILYATHAKYMDASTSSGSDSEDSQLGTKDSRGVSPPSSSYRAPDSDGTYTPKGNVIRPFDDPIRKRGHSVDLDVQRSNPYPINKSLINTNEFRSRNILDYGRRSESPQESSASSDLGRRDFNIGPPPRQDNRTAHGVGPSHVSCLHRPSPSTISTLHSKNDQTSSMNSRPIHNLITPALTPRQNWEDHAVQVRNIEGGVAYQCTWATPDGPCHYSSKKQLVKRHVETTHLKFKPFVCDICSKAFPQKTSLDIHRHGHTGDTPHQCIYDCGKSFKDPARRHRHHVEVHGYVPKQGKKKNQAAGTQMQETSPYESLLPLRMSPDNHSASTRG
ncbi:hypothetical protein B0H10DRAFT_232270 [Mycena sp. CBHHK59/15]|nr:hypothetical protein B0H10DRAFT_232270 [Mycena sp. CBHHK59/15]